MFLNFPCGLSCSAVMRRFWASYRHWEGKREGRRHGDGGVLLPSNPSVAGAQGSCILPWVEARAASPSMISCRVSSQCLGNAELISQAGELQLANTLSKKARMRNGAEEAL